MDAELYCFCEILSDDFLLWCFHMHPSSDGMTNLDYIVIVKQFQKSSSFEDIPSESYRDAVVSETPFHNLPTLKRS